MVSQNQQKVKKEITRVVKKAGKSFSVPERKFVLEMLTGILATGLPFQVDPTALAYELEYGL